MNSLTWSGALVTLDEWDSMPEDELQRHVEVVEGVLNLVPTPPVMHQIVSSQLGLQLQKAFGHELRVIPSVEVLLWTELLTVRVPDLCVVTLDDVRRQPRRFHADQVLLAVEVVSPGTVGTDRIMKVADYAEAGIPHYWIVDLETGSRSTRSAWSTEATNRCGPAHPAPSGSSSPCRSTSISTRCCPESGGRAQ